MITQINVLRVLAAFSIIAIHVTAGQAAVNAGAYWVNQLTRFASPLFVVMSGMVLAANERKRPSPSLGVFYRKRFLRVLIPYVLWSFFYELYTLWSQGLLDGATIQAVLREQFPRDLLRGTAFVHLYFILIMVQLYVLFPFLFRFLAVCPRTVLAATFSVSAAMQALIYAHQLGVLTLPRLPVPYAALFLPWLFYFVLGMAVMVYKEKWQDLWRKPARHGAVVLMWLLSFCLFVIDGLLSGTYAVSIKPSAFVYGIVTFLLFYLILFVWLPERMWERGQKAWRYLAQMSFLYYLAHPLILHSLVKASERYGVASLFHGGKGLFLLYVLTLLGTLMTSWLVDRAPFSYWLGGRRKSLSGERPVPGSPQMSNAGFHSESV
ncbi:MAG TPA: acyltransferase [Calditerricola sp.]